MSQLHIPTIRALEDLVIDMMEKDILHGILNQEKECVVVYSTIGRDVQSVDSLVRIVTEW
jgi:reverse gyrase